MGLIILVGWFVLSAMIGSAAHARGRGSIGWFLAALIFSPVIAWMFLLLLPVRYRIGNRWLTEREIRQQELSGN